MEQQKLIHCQGEWKMVQLLWRIVLQLPYKTKYTLIIRSNNCAPWYVLIELKQCVHKIICRQMFLAALFIIGNTWKQIRCPSVAEWTNSGTSRQWNFTQHWKEMNYQVTKKTWRNSFGGEKKRRPIWKYMISPIQIWKKQSFFLGHSPLDSKTIWLSPHSWHVIKKKFFLPLNSQVCWIHSLVFQLLCPEGWTPQLKNMYEC